MKPIIFLVFGLVVAMAQPAQQSCVSEVTERYNKDLATCKQQSNGTSTNTGTKCPTIPSTNPDEAPKKFVKVGDKCYYLNEARKPWADALRECKGLGASLALPTNIVENQLLSHLGQLHWAHEIWLGATDVSKKGTWVSVARNNTIKFYNWVDGQPSTQQDGNCLLMLTDNSGRWSNYKCSAKYYSVCEL